jgi:RNA polymerase sigma-70 factor (ECF subfamily)
MELETTLPPGFLTAAAPVPETDHEQLVAAHQHMVYRIAFSVLRNPSDASDAAQDTFLRLFRSAGKLSKITDQKAWIARIAWNAALDVKRRQRHAVVETPIEDLTRGVEELRAAGRSPEEIAVNGQMQRLLRQLIEALPESLREPLQLSTVQGLEYREIAEMLGITEAAVRARLFQARQKLKEKLDRLLGERHEF